MVHGIFMDSGKSAENPAIFGNFFEFPLQGLEKISSGFSCFK
jgi:hypothetical protein